MTTESTPVRGRERVQLATLIGPASIYLLFFFVIPLGIVLLYSFLKRGAYGQLIWEFTLSNYVRVFDPLYLSIFWRSVLLALAATVGSLLLAYPFAYYIARRPSARTRNLLLVLVMIPFWTNFLIRTYAWRVILGGDGPINSFLLWTGLI